MITKQALSKTAVIEREAMQRMQIRLKRIYETASSDDGVRILVDRLWPRGLSKERAKIDRWLREVAPSNALRRWFNHEPENWAEFKRRYFEELSEKDRVVRTIHELASRETVTLLFAASDTRLNNAVAFKEYVVRSNKSAGNNQATTE